MTGLIARDKPVLSTEYGPLWQTANKVCRMATPHGFSTLTKRLSLNVARIACPVRPVP